MSILRKEGFIGGLYERDTPISPQWLASDGEAVVKSDTTIVNYNSLYVGATGDVVVQLAKSEGTLTYKNVADGTILPIAVIRVLDATTATDIIGHF